ncbi:hypothetical protein SDRG_11772 [Saprolegnia diclina VS20]|uniref:Uncharacterized protein n=1 Tax=Saprolegnia diclina (strain VS20) TaxID=1156394 RepID=T0RKG0_SAPDV|nr:hypothetical protein SDRG_11772 [Saprolegnia diclina VS20]EQC30452.1 hypothetical protein SDRG_11772 [Saprolegnia diclina VS20]|eukprot:XP_008616045.1 hypothetical protein SDRG_11772 [Saprolegnia diclina VS20]
MVMIMHPWNDPIVLRRSWCVFEVYVAVTMGARFEIALAQDQEATFLADMAEDGAFLQMLATIKSENSEATIAGDRDGIFALIRAETSFVAVDRLIFSTLSTWIKTTLEASIASAPTPAEKAARWLQLGLIYTRETKDAESERCCRHAVDLFTQSRGPDAPETLAAASHLAYAIAYQRKPRDEWEPAFTASLASLERQLGAADCRSLRSRADFAASLAWNGDFTASLDMSMTLLDLQRHSFGLGDWRTASTLSMIGINHFQLGARRVAARWLAKALPIQEAHFGKDHTSTTLTISFLAGAFMFLGELQRALPLAQHLVETSERTRGPDNSGTMVDKMNLAMVTLMAGHLHEATTQLEALEDALVSRSDLSHHHREVLKHLAVAYWAAGKYDVAASCYRRIFEATPDKESAWLLVGFLLDAPPTTAQRDESLARVRQYMMTSHDDAPESWPMSCTVCCQPVHGRLAKCDSCPKALFVFCASCLQRHPRRALKFCAHDHATTAYATMTPPRRFFFEADLVSLDVSFDEIDGIFCAYETYCDAHSVPRHERLPRSSVPILSRAWHPML